MELVAKQPGPIGLRLKALRAFSFPLTALPVAVAAAVTVPVSQWNWGVLAASLVGAILLHGSGNLLNDYFDFKSGVDRKVEGDEGRPGRFLVRGQLQPRDVLLEAVLLLALVAPLAAYLVWQCGPGILAFGAAGVIGLYTYTGWPFQFKYRSLGELVIFLTFGPLLVLGAAFAQTGDLQWNALLVSIPVGMFTTAVLFGNNMRDLEEDSQAGMRSIARNLGLAKSRRVFSALVMLPPVLTVAFGVFGYLPRTVVIAALALVPATKTARLAMTQDRIPDLDVHTAQSATALFVLLFVGLLLQNFVGRFLPF